MRLDDITSMDPTLLQAALNAPRVIISITGPAAGQSETEMLRRKLSELDAAGCIFWGINSWTCSVADVLDLVSANGSTPTYVLLFHGGSPTSVRKEPNEARFYASTRTPPGHDSREWRLVPPGIHVRNVRGKNALALVFGSYEVVDIPVECDFSQYTFFRRLPSTVSPGTGQTVPSLTHQGRSTVCAVKGNHGARPYSRKLVGIATLSRECAVWVRK